MGCNFGVAVTDFLNPPCGCQSITYKSDNIHTYKIFGGDMSTQVIGSVNELDGPVSIMRDGETRSLAAGESIRAGDVITASDSGRTSIILSNGEGEPIGNLLVAPTGSVIVDTTTKNGQTAFVFEALSDDGVTLTNLDPDFADLVQLQGVEQTGSGGMFGLFGGGMLAGGAIGGSAAAVGASAVGLGLLASSSDDEGSGPSNSTGGGTVGGSDGGTGGGTGGGNGGGNGGGDEMGGTTGTPLDAGVDPVVEALAGTPLVAVSEPLAMALGGGDTGGDTGGGEEMGGTTGTPLDVVFDPLMSMAADSPLAPISSMLDPAVLTDALGGGLPV